MKSLKPETLLDYKFLSSVKLSPNGQQVAFVAKRANLKKNRYDSNLWLYDLENGTLGQLTSSEKDLAFAWQDDKHILFLSKRQTPQDEDSQETTVYRIATTGGEATPAFTINMKVDSIRPVDSNRLLFTTTADLNETPAPEEESHQAYTERKAKEEEEKDYHVIDEIPYWFNGKGYTSKKRSHLCLYDIHAEQSTKLTEGTFNLIAFDVYGEQVVLLGSEFDSKAPHTNDLYLLDLKQPAMTKLTDGTHIFAQPRFLNDKLIVVPGTDMQTYGINQNRVFYTYSLADNRLDCLTPNMDRSVIGSVGSDCRLGMMESSQVDGEQLYFHSTEGDSCYLNQLTADGRMERVVDVPGSLDSFDIKNGHIVYAAFRGDKLLELYQWKDGREEQLTHLNEEALREISISTPEHFVVSRPDDVELDAWIIRPVDFDPNQKYPAILEIHGGPKTVSSHTFFHEYQLLANNGYVVYFCNPRGSDGKGNAFADLRGKYGTIDYEDIMAVVDHVLASYHFVDPQRLGVTGGSYGGYMTNWIIGHTDRFQAAVSQRSIANWVSFSFNSDIGYRFGPDQMACTPWSDMDKLWFHSPLKYADRATTPTLFIHSAEDYRCWLPEGLQMFSALKYFGVDSRMVVFEGENHELSRGGKPKHRIRRLQEILNWFDKYLKP